MSQIYEWFSNNPIASFWITIISLAGVLMTITAFIVQMRDRRKKALCYTASSTVLLDNKISQIEGISINYHDTPIESLAVSEIHIWNAGNEIINESDFYCEQELKVTIPIGEKIIALTEPKDIADTSKTEVSLKQSNELIIKFDCYEPKQGTSFTICHTCILKKALDVSGKIKGGKLVDKSIDIIYKDGEILVETSLYNISIENKLFRLPYLVLSAFGVSAKKKK